MAEPLVVNDCANQDAFAFYFLYCIAIFPYHCRQGDILIGNLLIASRKSFSSFNVFDSFSCVKVHLETLN